MSQNSFKSNSAATAYWDANQDRIELTRTQTISDLCQISEHSGDLISRILAAHKDRNGSNAIGELLPWFFGNLVGLKGDKIQSFSKYWVALYAYIVFLDHLQDTEDLIHPQDAMSHAVLFTYACAGFGTIFPNSKISSHFFEYLSEAAKQQENSLPQNKIKDEKFAAEVALGKNSTVLALAHLCFALSNISSTRNSQRASKLISAFQLMDDLRDVDEDFRAGITSQVTRRLNENDKARFQEYGYVALIDNHTLQEILGKITLLLAETRREVANLELSHNSWALKLIRDIEIGLTSIQEDITPGQSINSQSLNIKLNYFLIAS